MPSTLYLPAPLARVGSLVTDGRRWTVFLCIRTGRLWTNDDPGTGDRLAEVIDRAAVEWRSPFTCSLAGRLLASWKAVV